MKDLIIEIIAEIKRDVHMNNLLPLKELLESLIKVDGNEYKLRRFLSEFPELREEYKDE